MQAELHLSVYVEIRPNTNGTWPAASNGAQLTMAGSIGKPETAIIRVHGDCNDAELDEAHRLAREAYASVVRT